jgi:GH25 family lysozyme M1 (1,4-beta-N-acetylmuramidase)
MRQKERQAMRQGIDVSRWQGQIDWAKVKAAGITFAILKCGGSDSGFYTDRTFEYNYAEAKKNGIAVGAYYFVGRDCITYEAGQADAKRMLSICAGKEFELPLFIDCEAQETKHKVGITDAILGFYDMMVAAGRKAGVYASTVSGFRDRIEDERIQHIPHWVAQYYTRCTYSKPWIIWQKSSKGRIDGINGNVDLDEATEQAFDVKTNKKTDLDVILAVLKGEYGCGADRRARLTAAGYNSKDVQDKINKTYDFINSIL